MRQTIRHGLDPLAGRKGVIRQPPGTYDWRTWLRNVFADLPNNTGTSVDVAATLEADPEIAPKLDRRPDPMTVSVPLWKRTISNSLGRFPEFVDTGVRKGKFKVYRFDKQVVQALQQGGRKRKA
ncbi:hypothetical protein GPECTOR_154g67 [Gonium pectorale]|uniref:Uncharacterized protein n=1 Tax=Gonium pectorale TaxID=33097 RepID=A0A150FXQ2_GONPE|nr:hypothetical protein GPECTOR_154g67 [Gonium pectorale]|eukprot:KXZ42376.1 hypothetical protein GPECTOR_154g67 [Gonium pectorale]